MDWTLPHRPLIKKMLYSSILWGHFLNWGSFLSHDSSLWQVDMRLVSTEHHSESRDEAKLLTSQRQEAKNENEEPEVWAPPPPCPREGYAPK